VPSSFIPPLDPPYAPDVAAELSKLMSGSDREPLLLFRTLARHLPLAKAWGTLGSHNLGRGTLPVRDRELIILRTCYLNRCEYEWGVHVRIYARAAGFSRDEWAATATPSGSCESWSHHDRDVLSFAEMLGARVPLTAEIRTSLRKHWDDAQFLEAAEVAGFYHGVSFIANVAEVECEDWGERFPR
jgi:alkylhydroperoxidase family enzyme